MKKSWTNEQFILAVKNNKSAAGVLRDLGLYTAGNNPKQVKKHAKELNLDLSHFYKPGEWKRLYHCNEQFFNILNNKNCYWAGFIAADGNISDNNVKIGLSLKDKQHLEKFKEIVKSNHPIIETEVFLNKKKYFAAIINIWSKQYTEDLKQYFNIVPAKSLILEPPSLIKEDDIRHFIRGNMDGDGTIRFQGKRRGPNWTITFLGTKLLLQWIKAKIQQFISGVLNPSVLKDKNIYTITFSGYQTKLISDWLYQDAILGTRLDRKYEKYLDLCEFYKNGPRQYISQYRGVTSENNNRFAAHLIYKGKNYYLGGFKTQIEAAMAYNKKAIELKLFDRLNVI